MEPYAKLPTTPGQSGQALGEVHLTLAYGSATMVHYLLQRPVAILLRKIPSHDDAGGNRKNSQVANGTHRDQSAFAI